MNEYMRMADRMYALDNQFEQLKKKNEELETENAELKKENEELPTIVFQQGAEWYKKKADIKLAKAKELLKEFVQHYKNKTIYVENMQDLLEQSEQFIKDLEK